MGKFLHIRMPWRHRKERTTKGFILETSPGLPQTDLDKAIFHPNWKLRPGWEYELKKAENGGTQYMFKKSQNGWLIAGFSEQDLGHERGLFFHRTDNPDGTFVYTPTKSPPVRIYNPAAGLPTPVRNPYGIAHSEPKFRVTGFGTEVCYR